MVDAPRSLADYFAELRAPRSTQMRPRVPGHRPDRDCRHHRGGADDIVSVAAFAKAKKECFRDRLGLKLDNGIPSHDTLNRVFAIIDPTQFPKCFLGWVESMSDRLQFRQIPIDGKTLRGFQRKTSAGHRMVPIASVWSSENGVTLAQVRTDEKSNEITAIPEWLALLDGFGALVSIDAAECQKTIASQIVGGQGDYLLAVKANQPRLYEDIKALADAAAETGYAGRSLEVTEEQSHGRGEFRSCFVRTNGEGIRDRVLWKGLKSVVCVVTSRKVNGKESSEVRYSIRSRRGSGKMFLGASRKHWALRMPAIGSWMWHSERTITDFEKVTHPRICPWSARWQ